MKREKRQVFEVSWKIIVLSSVCWIGMDDGIVWNYLWWTWSGDGAAEKKGMERRRPQLWEYTTRNHWRSHCDRWPSRSHSPAHRYGWGMQRVAGRKHKIGGGVVGSRARRAADYCSRWPGSLPASHWLGREGEAARCPLESLSDGGAHCLSWW